MRRTTGPVHREGTPPIRARFHGRAGRRERAPLPGPAEALLVPPHIRDNQTCHHFNPARDYNRFGEAMIIPAEGGTPRWPAGLTC
jgi:hypothetical protein